MKLSEARIAFSDTHTLHYLEPFPYDTKQKQNILQDLGASKTLYVQKMF